MYESHFGLRKRPFRPVPDADSYYPATNHEHVLSSLLQTIREDEGFALLTGEPGTGKTLLGHLLLDRLGDEVTGAFLFQGHFRDRAALLLALLDDLSIPVAHASGSDSCEQELHLALTSFLLKNYEAGKRTVAVLDEAQHLRPDLLEELRLLGNLEGSRGKAFQVIFLALPPFAEMLRLPELSALQQRVGVHVKLEALGLHEAADYVVSALRAAGGKPEKIVTDEALEILARGTGGVPRLLNRAMHRALQLACEAGQRLLDAEAAVEALSALGLGESDLDLSNGIPPIAPHPHAETPCALVDETTSPSVLVLDEEAETEEPPEPDGPEDLGQRHRLFTSPRRPA
jgi:type II secretory pathway predicted ATPase ExeA